MRSALIAITAITPSALLAQSDPTVQSLRQGCSAAATGSGIATSQQIVDDAHFCLGLVAGVGQVLSFNCYEAREGSSYANERLRAELPPSYGAGAQAFVNWTNENPDKWDWHASLGVTAALVEAFPCNN